MSFDIQQNFQTGDWVFNSVHDYAGAEGESLIQQRVHVRLKIERGSYMYDRSGTLGSHLRSLIGLQLKQARLGIDGLVRDALTPMDDIIVTEVEVHTSGDGSGEVVNPSQIEAKITYRLRPIIDISTALSQTTTVLISQ